MKTVIRSTAVLTTAQGLGYVISLAEVPILARALGATAYGELVWVQATALLASMVVDYGFNLSASREIARNKNDNSFMQRTCGNVFLAKLVLLLLVATPLLVAYLIYTPTSSGMAYAGFIYFVGFGMTPFWYFQGMERMGRSVAVETLTRFLALISLFLFVQTPEDKTLALTIMASGSIACTIVTVIMCRVELGGFRGTSIHGAVKQLKQSTAFFVYKSSGQLMTTAATTVLGAVVGKPAVGVFAPAEKVVKAVIGLAIPVFHAFYPHLSRLFIENPHKKRQQAFWLIVGVTASGFIAAIALYIAGPTILSWMLGPGYDEASDLLLLMVWLIPLRLLNQTLGFAVLLPSQKESAAGMAMLICSTLSLVLGAYLAAGHGASGMVAGLLIGDIALIASQMYLSRHMFKARKTAP